MTFITQVKHARIAQYANSIQYRILLIETVSTLIYHTQILKNITIGQGEMSWGLVSD